MKSITRKEKIEYLIITVLLMILVAEGFAIRNIRVENREQQEVTVSDLALSNAEALATGEESSNYGPADQVKCAGGLHKKICLCKLGYPACTETKCY